MSGSAGGILGLLRLHRDTGSDDVLERAAKCGEHLLAQPRLGPQGRRSWPIPGNDGKVLNGMSHGAAGFAYALAALAAATGARISRKRRPNASRLKIRATTANAAQLAGSARQPDALAMPMVSRRDRHRAGAAWHRANGAARWPHAPISRTPSPGVQLNVGRRRSIRCAAARSAASNFSATRRACSSATICATAAAQRLLAVRRARRATGDYRWNNGKRQFNLGLFRGLAGVGYTLLRQAIAPRTDVSLPNVLIWE